MSISQWKKENGLAPDEEVTTESLTAGFQGAFRTAAVIGALSLKQLLSGLILISKYPFSKSIKSNST